MFGYRRDNVTSKSVNVQLGLNKSNCYREEQFSIQTMFIWLVLSIFVKCFSISFKEIDVVPKSTSWSKWHSQLILWQGLRQALNWAKAWPRQLHFISFFEVSPGMDNSETITCSYVLHVCLKGKVIYKPWWNKNKLYNICFYVLYF